MLENKNKDIEIINIGLRPGEKLYEELMIGNQKIITQHPKIIQIKEKFEPLIKIKNKISKFNYRHNIENEKKTLICPSNKRSLLIKEGEKVVKTLL